jgi:hypothetical protein
MKKRIFARAILLLSLNSFLILFYQNCSPATSGQNTLASTGSNGSSGTPETPPVVVAPNPNPGAISTISPAISMAAFNNPDRGFHNYTKVSTSQSSHQADIAEGSTLAILMLDDLLQFSNGPISGPYLSALQAKFDMARNIGLKYIIMPSYYKETGGSEPAMPIILTHVSQLTSIMTLNKDVIYTMHTGFVGRYGEWHGTNLSDQNKKDIILAVLNGLPSDLKIAIRTPLYKKNIFQMSTPLIAGENQALANRVGIHNDCFLASADDSGTGSGFSMGSTTWRQFVSVQALSLSLPTGGETCGVSSYSSCSNALAQMSSQGWSYMNKDYHLDVIQGWKDNGCFDEINKRLGYRLQVKELKVPVEVSRTAVLNLEMIMENVGFAPMVNKHTTEIVLISSSGVEYYYDLAKDTTKWIPGLNNVTAAVSLASSGIPVGDYSVAIAIRDNAVALRSKPGFSVQLANVGVWNSAKGYNVIKNGSADLKIRILP